MLSVVDITMLFCMSVIMANWPLTYK